MVLRELSVLLLLCIALSASKASVREGVRKFPDGLLFGTSTASYQIEGAWDEDGKSENIWDHLTHNDPCSVKDCSNGDVANDSYHQIERDVQMMRELGIDYYRFSLSWTRILPTSFPDKINEAGVQYYNNLINEMLKYNIQPMITLYHWDLPQKLQDMGGWTNPYIVEWYGDYARTVFELFGDRVQYWITLNEPHAICHHSYGAGYTAPRLSIKGVAEYMCAKNVLLAHAKAYHIYNDEFKPIYGGEIGITLDAQWYEPVSENDIEAVLDYNYFTWQLYAHPIFSETGDFPASTKKKIAEKSASQGFHRSRLPEFSSEEVEYVRGSSDFFGLNHYVTYLVYRKESVQGYYDGPSLEDDMEVLIYEPNEYNYYVPSGFYSLLNRIKQEYNTPKVYITENGYSTKAGLEDDDRITNYRGYLDEMLNAIEDGCDVRMYTAWSIMDNFEWMSGYTIRFGLYEVDYSDPGRARTPRKSAFMYKELLRTRELDPSYDPPADRVMTIDPGH